MTLTYDLLTSNSKNFLHVNSVKFRQAIFEIHLYHINKLSQDGQITNNVMPPVPDDGRDITTSSADADGTVLAHRELT